MAGPAPAQTLTTRSLEKSTESCQFMEITIHCQRLCLSACQMCNVTAPLVKKRAGGISLVARIEGRGLDGEVKECS